MARRTHSDVFDNHVIAALCETGNANGPKRKGTRARFPRKRTVGSAKDRINLISEI